MMPVEDLSKGFSRDLGRPTKEHYSVCGLILLKDYYGWTNQEAVDQLNIKIDKQRLDSSHVFSNMADWSRSMLLFKTTKRFLVQVKRHESKL